MSYVPTTQWKQVIITRLKDKDSRIELLASLRDLFLKSQVLTSIAT